MRPENRENRWALLFLIAFLGCNLVVLTRFPLVHSDESWLAGLTRNMMETGSLGITEPFFDLKPRFPHAIKLLFHLFQMPFLLVFGYSAFSVRLMSLLFGAVGLFLAFRCARKSASLRFSLSFMVLLSLNAQFLSAAHTARQEIVLLCGQLVLLFMFLDDNGTITARFALRAGIVTGLCVGIHPNSFLLAMGCGLTMLLLMLARRRFSTKPLLMYIAATGGIALVFVGLSFLFDNQFPAHYLAYGETEFDLKVSFSSKFLEFGYYVQKLWHAVSGTYRLPELRPQLILCLLLPTWASIRAVRTGDAHLIIPLGMSLGALAGTVVIGRYNQLSAVLWMLPCLMLIPPLLAGLRMKMPLLLIAAVAFAVSSVVSFLPDFSYSYRNYLKRIAAYVSPDETTLGNLNAGFYFENNALFDYRNLTYLQENGLSFAEYVRMRGIEVILWPEEMDFIYDHRPLWNIIYGNPRYVEEVEDYLSTHCTYLGEFEDPGYAVRIVQEIGKPYKVRIYRIIP